MDTMKLYRLLQKLVGDINPLVIKLYKGEIESEEAKVFAIAELEHILAELKKE